MSQPTPQPTPQTTPQAMPQTAPQTTPQALPQPAPQTTPQALPQTAPQPIPKRIKFGGDPQVPNTHASIVQLGYGQHSARNPNYTHYAGLGGGVAFAQKMPKEAQRGLAYNAYEDMREDFIQKGISQRRMPGAMGSLWVNGAVRREVRDEDTQEEDGDDNNQEGNGEGNQEGNGEGNQEGNGEGNQEGNGEGNEGDYGEGNDQYYGEGDEEHNGEDDEEHNGEDDEEYNDEDEEEYYDQGNEEEGGDPNVRRGHQIYMGSSMKVRSGEQQANVVLEKGLRNKLLDANGQLPNHRRSYKCAEPGMCSDHRYDNNWDHEGDDDWEQGGRVYVVNGRGQHLPPCGHAPEYGCRDFCAVVGARDLYAS